MPLTETGWRQAYGLVRQLPPYPVSRILSRPALRCTHGELIGQVITRLLAAGMTVAREGAGEPRWAKGSVWVLERAGAGADNTHGAVRRGDYLEPVALSLAG